MPDPDGKPTRAEIAALLDRPELASVRHLATTLVRAILEELPEPSMLDAENLLTMCATVVVMSEDEGQRKMSPLVATNEKLIAALERRVAQLEESFEALDVQRRTLHGVVEEQETLIIAQERALDAAIDAAGRRELRLPH